MAANRLEKARAQKTAGVASAVADVVMAPSSPSKAVESKLQRQTLLLPSELVLESRKRLLGMLEDGTAASLSQIVEIALRELFERPDFDDVIDRHGVSARRRGPNT